MATQLKREARLSFVEGDLPAARDNLTKLLELYREQRRGDPYQYRQRLVEVTHEYLRIGDLKQALAVLGEAADLGLPDRDGDKEGFGSVAAGLHRRLAGLDADERFELLREWSMPNELRRSVRVLTAITPTDAPPTVFARALGERPRRDSFAVPEVGEVSGLFSTAWGLATAAEEAGSLRRLTAELTNLAEDDVPNARFALTLAKIVRARREDDQVLDELKAQPDADTFIAAACLTQDWLLPIGERMLKTRLEQTYGRASPLMRPFLRRAVATGVRRRFADASPDVVTNSDLKWWIPASGPQASGGGLGAAQPIWLSHDNHILHLAGSGNDQLFFKYPLIGEFEFSCEAQNGGPGGTEGAIAYGGLDYEVSTGDLMLRVSDANGKIVAQPHNPYAPDRPLATFNRISLKSSVFGVTLLSNMHPAWTDDSKHTGSPWIGLRSLGDRAPMFRNLKIQGNPVIPRQVTMSEGDSLRGWVVGSDGQDEWLAIEGVINGRRLETNDDAVQQSRLAYQRPLQSGESISYEFQYEPGQLEVHPTLGRIALLIEPEGVRLHWITDGDREWTGLAEDNAIVEPLNRRGPKPLPLVAGEWNRVLLALENRTLTLSLNDATIYTREMEPENARTFGFYHDRNRSEARVRNVVMRGDWPERLTDEQLDNLTAVLNPIRSTSDRRVLGAIFDDKHVHGSVLAVHRRATKLPAEERYAFLSDWVLPGADHQTLRLALDFTPTNPAPPVSDEDPAFAPGQSRVTTGGDLVSPALDLVAVAKELDKLDALRERVAAVPVADELQRRSQLCMLALVDIGLGDLVTAKATLDELASIVVANPRLSFLERWPETLAIWEAARFAETRDAVRDMAYQIILEQIRKNLPSGYEAWNSHMRALAGRVRYFDLRDGNRGLPAAAVERFSGQSPLADWVLASRETTRTRGQGFPRSRWELSSRATVEKFASHHDEFLFYRIPLRGNFEVECDVSGFGWRESNLWVAGRWVGPAYTHQAYDIGDFRDLQRLPLEPPLSKTGDWIRYRAVVRDGVCTIYFNGRKVHERALVAEHDPWIAIRGPYATDGAVRNLRITGQPEIPTELKLTDLEDLPGWLPINHGHLVGPNRKWQQLGDLARGGGIRGICWDSSHPGSNQENLLRYHRPMVENGTIEYEFYYLEGARHVHPALDRLAFMLEPDGVRIHWITDCEFDRTELDPDNRFEEPDNRRGPKTLPLNLNAWNRLQLSLAGDMVDLTLNGQLVYQRELEPTNQRTFGLFHFADQTEALVRNVVWRGDWPRELPAVPDQELAGEGSEFLDDTLEKLTAVFAHDFVADGLDLERFVLDAGKLTDFAAEADGLHVTRPGGEGYNDSTIAPRLTIGGDFDIVAEFDRFTGRPTEGGSSGALLQAFLSSDKSDECLLYRRRVWHRAEQQPIVQGSFVAREVRGERRIFLPSQVVEASSGRLRMARRGETVYFLFAENDSPHYRLFGSAEMTRDDVHLFKLITQTHLAGLTTVVWKNLTIRAEELSGLALQDAQQALAKLNKRRDELSQRFEHDFAIDAMSDKHFQRWGPFQPADKNGVRMISIGTDRWTSSGFNSLVGLAGDFDVSVTFDELKFAKPEETMDCSFYLQLEFPDAAKTQANLVLVEKIDGDRQIVAQVRVLDARGSAQYRKTRTEQAGAVDTMRLARRGKTVSFLYRKKGSDHDEILAQQELLDLPVTPYKLRLLLHTGGDDRQSEVVLKQFSVRAEKLNLNPENTVE